MNFSINFKEVARMFEVLGNNKKARQVFYSILIAVILFAIFWKLPETLTAISTLRK